MIAAIVLVAIVGVVIYFVTRPTPTPPTQAASPTPVSLTVPLDLIGQTFINAISELERAGVAQNLIRSNCRMPPFRPLPSALVESTSPAGGQPLAPNAVIVLSINRCIPL